jgi:glycine oxidase
MTVVVAGAGIIGCSTALELARRGYRVQVFDAHRAGSGATFATAGILAPFVHSPSPPPLQELLLESLRMYDDFVAAVRSESLLDVEYRRCGTFEIASTSQDVERLHQLESAARAAGVTTEWREPDVAANRPAGLLVPSHAYVRVEQLIPALRRAAERHSAQFHEEEPIERVQSSSNRISVKTARRQMECSAIVIAAGSWSDTIAVEPVGVRPVRGQILRIRFDGQPLSQVLWEHDSYIVPWLDGTVLVGATLEDVGFEQRVTVEGVRQLLAVLNRLLPDSGEATFLEARAGLRPASADGMPVIRASSRTPRVIYATGHYRNGVLLAPLTARTVASLVAAVDR